MDVSVVIVTHNSRPVIEPCLDSLKKNSLFAQTEVIVVDNASDDGTVQLIRNRYPWVNVTESERNMGFSVGVNVGIRRARGRYILILNPDTVVREQAIEVLVRFMEDAPDAGIVAPKLVYEDGNLQYSCRRFYNWKVLLLRRTFFGRVFKNSRAVADHLMMDFDHEHTRRVDWVIGACMLVRREAVESVGLLDERFFLYFEDVDWCYRMKQKGWSIYYQPEAIVVHTYARESAQRVFNRSFVAHLSSLVRYYEKWSFVLYFIKRYREVLKVTLFLVADVIAFNLAFLAAYYTRLILAPLFTRTLIPIQAYEQFVVYENVLFVLTFFVLGLYRIRRETSSVDELFEIGKGVGLACILLMASTYLSQIHSYSRMVVAFLAPYAVAFDWLTRSFLRRVHRGLLAQRIDLKRVCIVGPAGDAARLEKALVEDARRGIEVAGIVATDVSPSAGGRSLGDVSKLGEIVDAYRIQQLIFLPGAAPEDKIAEFVVLGRRRTLDVVAMKDYAGVVIHQAELTSFAGRPAIVYRRDTRYAVDRLAKRLLDMALGSCFLVVSLPISVVYSLYTAIRGGTPYTRESRLGWRGEPFMFPLAGVRSPNGPSDIVNLPLFWLVVTGKLSIVGPYALPGSFDGDGRIAPFRYDVRPGVTGPWRAGSDDEVPLSALLAQDAGYMRNWSLSEDLKILLATLGHMLTGKKRSLRLDQSPRNANEKPE